MLSTSFQHDGWVVVDFDASHSPRWAHWFDELDEAERFMALIGSPDASGPIPTLRSRMPRQRSESQPTT